MNKQKKWILCMFLLLTAVLATGCMEGQVDVKINGDGSADLTYGMIVDKKTYDPQLLEEFLGRLEAGKFVVEQRDIGDFLLINARVYLPRFRTVFDPIFVYEEEMGRIPVGINRNWLTSEYTFDFTYDMLKTKAFLEETLGLEEAWSGRMRFSVTLPQEPEEHNADIVNLETKNYTWELDTQGTTPVFLSVRTYNVINILITVGVPVLGLIAFFNDRRKKRKNSQNTN